ncbi:NADH/ubiquinone oxidoreductase [Neurospora crassa]|nr:NADH:ubiquinone oxidoreductase 14.8kD subunit [Neurospora crassa OR74A]EAA28068.3 NADH:ubiquinone oxidoreductase 14.8kD subunit [Neurospora crassa OR74A]KHE87897.1 NADH/ubiquinone oxidoreductase [Neurospora crassa]|eukprot:XP_957304.3 NADH:ubiquinone oxidoreductase 14.8kD subunit [Neurospora crassa OR74A]
MRTTNRPTLANGTATTSKGPQVTNWPKMPITPTKYAITTRQSANWSDAKRRVFALYRRWLRSTPEMQSMYSLPLPISVIRTRIRQEFERNRFVNKLPVVDVLLTKGHADYQETMNFWRQTTHMMSYFNEESFRGAKRLPSSFIDGFLQGRN